MFAIWVKSTLETLKVKYLDDEFLYMGDSQKSSAINMLLVTSASVIKLQDATSVSKMQSKRIIGPRPIYCAVGAVLLLLSEDDHHLRACLVANISSMCSDLSVWCIPRTVLSLR